MFGEDPPADVSLRFLKPLIQICFCFQSYNYFESKGQYLKSLVSLLVAYTNNKSFHF